MNLTGSEYGPRTGSREHNNERSDSTKGEKCTEQFRDCRLLKNGFSSWSVWRVPDNSKCISISITLLLKFEAQNVIIVQ
jgi:hypothetical protein